MPSKTIRLAAMPLAFFFETILISPIEPSITSLRRLSCMPLPTWPPTFLSDIQVLCPLSLHLLLQQILLLWRSKSPKHRKILLRFSSDRGTTPMVHPSTVPPPTGGSVLKYYHKHGYQKTHAGATCMVMTGNPTLYTAQHLSAKDPLTPLGGNPTIRG